MAWKPSPLMETILRWSIFGSTCLSWVFVVASTGTCSFVSDSFYTNVNYGLFCWDVAGQRQRYNELGLDLPGAVVAAQLFGTVACLCITAVLIAVTLVIFVLPTVHAVRAWWTARILFCVGLLSALLTFSMSADTNCDGSCDASAGSVLNSLNVLILITLVTLSFLIGAPTKPLFGVLESAVRPAAPAPMVEAPVHPDLEADDDKPIVVSPQPVQTSRTEEVTPEGHRIVRETVTHPDGRQEVTETMEEPSLIVEKQQRDKTFISTEEMTTPEGNRVTVERTKHTDGREEIVETVEEPSMIGNDGEGDIPMEYEMVEEQVEYANGTNAGQETVTAEATVGSCTSRDPSVIGDATVRKEKEVVKEPRSQRRMDPPEN